MSIILRFLFIGTVLMADVTTDPACSFITKSSTERIKLTNQNNGWVEVYNKRPYSIRLVNMEKPQYSYTVHPYGRRSFNFRGSREVGVFGPLHRASGYYPAYMLTWPEQASEALIITKCQSTDPRVRFNDLQLMN